MNRRRKNRRITPELRREVMRLAAKGLSYRQIPAQVDTSRGAVGIMLRPLGGVARPDMLEPMGKRLSLEERVEMCQRATLLDGHDGVGRPVTQRPGSRDWLDGGCFLAHQVNALHSPLARESAQPRQGRTSPGYGGPAPAIGYSGQGGAPPRRSFSPGSRPFGPRRPPAEWPLVVLEHSL